MSEANQDNVSSVGTANVTAFYKRAALPLCYRGPSQKQAGRRPSAFGESQETRLPHCGTPTSANIGTSFSHFLYFLANFSATGVSQ